MARLYVCAVVSSLVLALQIAAMADRNALFEYDDNEDDGNDSGCGLFHCKHHKSLHRWDRSAEWKDLIKTAMAFSILAAAAIGVAWLIHVMLLSHSTGVHAAKASRHLPALHVVAAVFCIVTWAVLLAWWEDYSEKFHMEHAIPFFIANSALELVLAALSRALVVYTPTNNGPIV